jgi:hypothetical protein
VPAKPVESPTVVEPAAAKTTPARDPNTSTKDPASAIQSQVAQPPRQVEPPAPAQTQAKEPQARQATPQPAEPARDPNTSTKDPASAVQSQVAQPPRQVEPPAPAQTQAKEPQAKQATPQPAEPASTAATTPVTPAATQKPAAPAQAAAQPPALAAEPNKPALDFDNPANQGFAPSIYMGVIENAAPVYHFVSTTNKRHFCTIKEDEKYKILDNQSAAWKYQGIAFFAYPEGHQPEGARPVYRFKSDTLGHYFYTMDETIKDMMVKDMAKVWKFEGVAWYAPPARPQKEQPKK